MAKKTKIKKKNIFYKFLAKVINLFMGKYKIIGLENIPDEPTIIVSNHCKLNGPLCAELKFPKRKKIWCIGRMFNLKEAPQYAFEDFWSYKPKWTHWFYRILSYLVTPLLVFVNRNADAIPVYKDSRGITTFKHSIKAIKEGCHMIIFPEHHVEFNEIVNDFQTKFVDLARLYHKDSGKEIMFVPMYLAPTIKTVIYGKPIKFNSADSIDNQRKIVCDYLKNEITNLAKSLPVHIVTPYENIRKKHYPKSK